jgi:hypothetical protein
MRKKMKKMGFGGSIPGVPLQREAEREKGDKSHYVMTCP